MSRPSFVYVTYIAATADKVFAALTDADMSERYWDGNRVVSDWTIGSPFMLKLKRESDDITGTVLEFDPPRRLAYSFHAHHEGLASEGASRVTFELEPHRDQVKLTIIHDGFEPGSRVFEHICRGWPHVMSSLKSFVESGRGMLAPWYAEQAASAAAGA